MKCRAKKKVQMSTAFEPRIFRFPLVCLSYFYHPQPLQNKSGFIKMGGPGVYLSPAFKRSNTVCVKIIS